MAIVKDLNEIKDLIPEPDYRFYGSNISEVPSEIIDKKPLYAFVVSSKANTVISAYRAYFSLIKRGDNFYLMTADYDGLNQLHSDFIKAKKPSKGKLKITDWPFMVDKIGLHMKSSFYDKNIIYFGTMANDIKTVRETLKNKVVTLEPVLV